MSVTRRRFLSNTTAAVAGASTASLFPTAIRTRAQGVSPSDKIVVGVIGCKGMGFSDVRSLLRMNAVECGALCDVDSSVLHERAGNIEEMTAVKPQLYSDYRQLRRHLLACLDELFHAELRVVLQLVVKLMHTVSCVRTLSIDQRRLGPRLCMHRPRAAKVALRRPRSRERRCYARRRRSTLTLRA